MKDISYKLVILDNPDSTHAIIDDNYNIFAYHLSGDNTTLPQSGTWVFKESAVKNYYSKITGCYQMSIIQNLSYSDIIELIPETDILMEML